MARAKTQLVICIRSDDCIDLKVRKVYPVLPGAAAAKDGYLRIIVESGEDYLYPAAYFVAIEVPVAARRHLSPQALA